MAIDFATRKNVESDLSANLLTLRAIAERNGVSFSTVNRIKSNLKTTKRSKPKQTRLLNLAQDIAKVFAKYGVETNIATFHKSSAVKRRRGVVTAQKLQEIMELLSRGKSVALISQVVDLSRPTIYRIKNELNRA